MIGTILGNRYELLEKIGDGGMAEVYKAKCHLLNRFVAVKILKEQFNNDSDFVEKFKREATAAASLCDNNIVNIYDVGSQENTNFIVMEYVKGKTLKQLIKEKGRFPYKVTIDVGIQIAKALECAHKNNLIHRDIKPHNIMVTDDGLVKVTDFGIAKISDSVTITNTSKVLGSAHYFSPEQAKGNYVDFRTDIYSFGIVLYEMITGKVPYDAESPVSVALKHIQEAVVPPKNIIDSIPESLNRLILKCIEKEPIARYQNVKEISIDLQRIKEDSNCVIAYNSLEDDSTKIMDAVNIADYENKENTQEYEEDDDGDDDKTKSIIKSKKFKKIALIASVVLILAVVGGTIGIMVAKRNLPGNKVSEGEVLVPKIKGLTKEEAKEKIEEVGLKFVYVGKEKSDMSEGTVVRCNPDEGKSVKLGSDVRVSVSGGPNNLTVPDVRENNINTAKDIINNAGLKVGRITLRYSDNVLKDIVINQTPRGDEPADKNTKVNLVVSKGPKDNIKEVPNVKDRSFTEAKNILIARGFKIGIATSVATNDRDKDGKVFNQIPGAKSKVKEGSTVNISYYKYEEVAP